MNTTLNEQVRTIISLLHRDAYIFRHTFLHRLKMALYWVLITVFVTNMFLPSMGLHNFAPFILISSAISYGLFIGMQNAMNLVNDITSNQVILYELTLPVPQWMIFLKIIISNIIQAFLISISIVPCGLMILMNFYAFPAFSFIKFVAIFVCSSIFYGAFSLVLAHFLRNMSEVDNVWLRILFPLWYLGCFQFPWKTLYKISPYGAYADLFNPMTWIMEAARSATIDPTGSLPFWTSCGIILCYAGIAGWYGIRCIQRRLDCL